ncbi:MAG TPA: hypothetical protein VM692_03285 [Gammaproteobacteria bacterium]|nr:hypothetical protein [Gammaproteobacteria bacterium]
MKSEPRLINTRHRCVIAALLATAAVHPVAGNEHDKTYTWSAELVALDEQARTLTVQSRLVSDSAVDFDSFDSGDRLMLTWSGLNTAAGVRRLTEGAAAEADELTLPVEFVSPELDGRYVRFKVAVPSDDLAKLKAVQPGQYVTATSPRRASRWEEAVVDVRPYNDVH